jgi:hypothetical protein
MGTIRRRQASWDVAASDATTEESAAAPAAQLDQLSREEFGLAISEYEQIVELLLRDFEPTYWSIVRAAKGDVVSAVARHLNVPESRAGELVALMTMTPRPEFLKLPPPYQHERPYPWKYGRANSFIRRPLVLRAQSESGELLWGVSHLWKIPGYVRSLTLGGQLQPHSAAMRAFVGSIHDRLGREFEELVRSVLRADVNLVVKGPTKKVAGRRICGPQGQDLGDIDALAAWRSRKVLYVLECKDFSVARTPAEVSNELNALFRDSDKGTCACTRHLRRVEWVASHLAEVLSYLEIEVRSGWKVVPVLVTSMELVGSELEGHAMPAATLAELQHDGLQELTRRHSWTKFKR